MSEPVAVTEPADASLDASPPPTRPRRRRRRSVRVAAGVSVVGLMAGAVVLSGRGFGGTPAPRSATGGRPPATAQVTNATLTQTEQVGGTLGYGLATPVFARAALGTPGQAPDAAPGQAASTAASVPPATTNTMTWLPPIGRVVHPGEPVYRVDDQPVVLVVGDTPPYRALTSGVEGPDVRTLEANLRAFGYSGFTVDDSYTSKTAQAVERWQHDLGRQQTGTVDADEIVVAPGAVRVAEHRTTVGADASGEVLAYTGTTRVVTVPLEVTEGHLVHRGLETTVTLPGGRTVTGEVAGVGTVASATSTESTSSQPADASAGQSAVPTVAVTVTIADQSALGSLDAAPVSLTLVVAAREDVLTVPVGALVALAEGGYGVQVVEGDTTRYVPVETGMFADGQVEISGDEVVEGMTVGVPA